MNQKDYQKRLTAVYKDFWNTNGECQCFGECRKNLKDELPKFRQDRARIGQDYGEPDIPKIVCVGMEGKIDKENLDDKKLLAKYLAPSPSAQNPHYNGVKFVLAYLLSSFCGKEKPSEPSLKNQICSEYNWTTSRYCLLNLYKCAFVPKSDPEKASGLTHTRDMRQNCPEILLREFDALEPDVIVIQTTQFPNSFWRRLAEKYHLELLTGDGKKNNTSLYKGKYNDREILVVFTYHGASPRFRSKEYISGQLTPVLDRTVAELQKIYK